METLLAVEAMDLGLYGKKSNIDHPMAGNRVYAQQVINVNNTVVCFYCFIICRDLSDRRAKDKHYRKAIYGFTPSQFLKQALSVRMPSDLKVPGLDGTKLSVPYVKVFPI